MSGDVDFSELTNQQVQQYLKKAMASERELTTRRNTQRIVIGDLITELRNRWMPWDVIGKTLNVTAKMARDYKLRGDRIRESRRDR